MKRKRKLLSCLLLSSSVLFLFIGSLAGAAQADNTLDPVSMTREYLENTIFVPSEEDILKKKIAEVKKDTDSARYVLGTCKNKNMDNEVLSLELLEEIEHRKKELKACQ